MSERWLSSLADLQRELGEAKVRFLVADDGSTISVPVEVGGVACSIFVRWAPTPGLVQVILPLPLSAPSERRTKMALTICEINHHLALPGLQMEPQSGRLSFRAPVLMEPEGRLSLSLLRSMMNAALATAQQQLPALSRAAGLARSASV